MLSSMTCRNAIAAIEAWDIKPTDDNLRAIIVAKDELRREHDEAVSREQGHQEMLSEGERQAAERAAAEAVAAVAADAKPKRAAKTRAAKAQPAPTKRTARPRTPAAKE